MAALAHDLLRRMRTADREAIVQILEEANYQKAADATRYFLDIVLAECWPAFSCSDDNNELSVYLCWLEPNISLDIILPFEEFILTEFTNSGSRTTCYSQPDESAVMLCAEKMIALTREKIS